MHNRESEHWLAMERQWGEGWRRKVSVASDVEADHHTGWVVRSLQECLLTRQAKSFCLGIYSLCVFICLYLFLCWCPRHLLTCLHCYFFLSGPLLPLCFFVPYLQVLWLLSFDDKNTLADAVDKYCIGVPPIQWLAWIPQLLTCLVGSEGKPLLNLISQVRPFIRATNDIISVCVFKAHVLLHTCDIYTFQLASKFVVVCTHYLSKTFVSLVWFAVTQIITFHFCCCPIFVYYYFLSFKLCVGFHHWPPPEM